MYFIRKQKPYILNKNPVLIENCSLFLFLCFLLSGKAFYFLKKWKMGLSLRSYFVLTSNVYTEISCFLFWLVLTGNHMVYPMFTGYSTSSNIFYTVTFFEEKNWNRQSVVFPIHTKFSGTIFIISKSRYTLTGINMYTYFKIFTKVYICNFIAQNNTLIILL